MKIFGVLGVLMVGVGVVYGVGKVERVRVVGRKESRRSYLYGTVLPFGGGVEGAGGRYEVSGATLSLRLEDGRVVVVNCNEKFRERFRGPVGNRRSCRVPVVDDIEAEFHGDKAKLIWDASIDGKKKESETYKILGVFGKPGVGGVK
jgi:hypothetical protein